MVGIRNKYVLYLTLLAIVNVLVATLYNEHLATHLVSGNLLTLISLYLFDSFSKLSTEKGFLIYAFLLALFVSLVAISPVTVQSGWPSNHESFFWKSRMVNYYQHFLELDFFPIWSAGDCFTLGTPLPLFYHKLYYFFSAMTFLFVQNVKTNAILVIILFLMINAFGIFKCLTLMKIEKHVALPVAVSIIMMNYTNVDWLGRGNLAEFSALCIIPWLVHWCIKLITTKEFSFSIVVILTLLFLAHNIIAFYGFFIILFAVLISLYHEFSLSRFKAITFKSLLSAAIFLLINSIYFIPMLAISDDYDIGRIRIGQEVGAKFMAISRYFYNRYLIWGNHNYHVSVEFSLVFMILFVFAFGDALVNKYKEVSSFSLLWTAIVNWLKKPIVKFLVISLFFFSYLQHSNSLWLYNLIPGADFIQFPWRLLTYIQVLLLCLFAYVVGRQKLQWFNKRAYSYLLLFLMIITYPYLRYFDPDGWPWIERDKIEEVSNTGVWGTAGEYNPIVKSGYLYTQEFFEGLSSKGIESTISEISIQNLHGKSQLFKHYSITSTDTNTLILPINYSGLEEVWLTTNGVSQELSAYRINIDPRVRLNLPAGEYKLKVTLPTIRTSFRKFFQNR